MTRTSTAARAYRRWVDHQGWSRHVRPLRPPGVLVALGYLGIAARAVAWLLALFDGTPWEFHVAQTTPTIGFGLAGFACWRWIVGCPATNADPLHSAPSRWMAAASVVTAAGWAAATYYYFHYHQRVEQGQDHGGPSTAVLDRHYRLRMAGSVSIVVGLLLAGVGFRIASRGTRSATETIGEAIPVP